MTDESNEREDARVRGAFAALRAVDQASTPAFERTWSAAEREARTRSRRLAITAAVGGLGAAAAMAAAAALVVVTSQPEEPDDARALASSVSGMRSEPLAFLLEAPSESVVTKKSPFARASGAQEVR